MSRGTLISIVCPSAIRVQKTRQRDFVHLAYWTWYNENDVSCSPACIQLLAEVRVHRLWVLLCVMMVVVGDGVCATKLEKPRLLRRPD